MNNLELQFKIASNPLGIKSLLSNRQLSTISVRDGNTYEITSDYGIFPTVPNDGKKCFIIGQTNLGNKQYTLTAQGGYGGYIIRETVDNYGKLPNANGSTSWILETNGVAVVYIRFDFDRTAEQYPKTIILYGNDGNEVLRKENNTDYIFLYNDSVPVYKIEFADWSKAGYPACITNIESVPNELSVPKRNIYSVSSAQESQSNGDTIRYGVLASTGTFELLDYYSDIYKDYLFRTYARFGWLNKNSASVVLSLNGSQIRQHRLSANAKYDEYTRKLSISVEDKLSVWEQCEVPDTEITADETALTLLKKLLANYGSLSADEIANAVSKKILVGNLDGKELALAEMPVGEYLQCIKIPQTTPKDDGETEQTVLKQGSLASDIDKICTLAQLNCYCDTQGKVIFDSARPIMSETAILEKTMVPTNLQSTEFNYSLIVANNYNQVYLSSNADTSGYLDNPYSVSSNELFEAGAYFSANGDEFATVTMAELVKSNILSDFQVA